MTTSPKQSAYELSSKPVNEITDEDLEIICADLRGRRAAYGKGKADTPAKKKSPVGPVSAAQKKDNTAALLAELDLGL